MRREKSNTSFKTHSKAEFSSEHFLKLENSALKKKNKDIARSICDLKSRFREIEYERNVLHKQNACMIIKHRQVKKVAKEVCNGIMQCLQLACQDINKLLTAIESSDELPYSYEKDAPSLANLPDVESQLLKSATCTSELIEDNEKDDPKNVILLRNERLDDIEESVSDETPAHISTVLKESNSSNKENSASTININLSYSPKKSDTRSLKRRNIATLEKACRESLDSEYEEPNSLLTNIADESVYRFSEGRKENAFSPDNTNIELNFNSTLRSTSTPYNNTKKQFKKIKEPSSEQSEIFKNTKELPECKVIIKRLSNNLRKVSSPKLSTSPVPRSSPRPTRVTHRKNSVPSNKPEDESFKLLPTNNNERTSDTSSKSSLSSVKSDIESVNRQGSKRRKKSFDNQQPALISRPKRAKTPMCLKEASTKTKLRRE